MDRVRREVRATAESASRGGRFGVGAAMTAGWEVEGFIRRLTARDNTNSERLVLEAISHLRAFSRDCDALRENNQKLQSRVIELEEALDNV